ncbi:ATP-binding protein [Sphingomonas sp. ZB1N12]|uniref:ATP-binding response regulator n=1 Tax=Sphingomonas arabinosi TaxID=3096160 RepID=UPI002FC69376
MMYRWIVALVAAALSLAVAFSLVSAQPADVPVPDVAVGRYEATVADANATMLVDPAKALPKAVVAERYGAQIASEHARGVAIATAQWLQGEALLRINDPDKADPLIRGALASVKRYQPRSKLHADLLISTGWLDSYQGHVGSALIDYQLAFTIYRKLGDPRGQSRALVFIAMLYTQAKEPQTADRYYQQALDIYQGDVNIAVSVYNNRALVLAEDHQYKKAAEQFKLALDLAKQLNSRNLLQLIYMNIARVQLELGNLTLADRAIANGRAMADPSDPSLAGRLTAIAAQLALQRGDLPRANRLIQSALVGIDPKTTGTSYRDFHQTAYDIFEATGDAGSALVHLQALKRLDDAGTKLATDTKTALMAARFDFANQELKISQLKASELQRGIAFERAQARTQRHIFFGAGGAVAVVIALLAIGLVTLRRSRDQVRAANDDLAITNSALGKALSAKTEFLATTSHEIRTPLNGILGMTQVMLADPNLSADMRDRLGVVHGAGITMRALVNDILDVAKMETGNLTIETAPFDVCATVTDAARMWEEQARAKGLSFTVTLDGCPSMIMGDAARVRQIVFNLLSNALKFTKVGHVALNIEVGDDDRLRVAVSDSGIGIPADKIEDIFESFKQADAGTTRQFGGTGLGLSICRNLARAMGGDVSVSSVVGQGATFTLVLPLVRADAAVVDAVETDTRPITLVVDRNPITRSMFRTLMAPHGGPVVFAATVDDAVGYLGGGNVARVLIDDATIRSDGKALAGLSRIADAARVSGADTTLLWPVSAEAERIELLQTGITRVIAKPVTGSALVAAMFDGSVSENNAKVDLVSHAA